MRLLMCDRRRVAALVPGLIAAALLSGCAGLPGTPAPGAETTMTEEQSLTNLNTVFDDVQSLVGGEWVDEDLDSPRGCSQSAGAGVQHSSFRVGTAPSDRLEVFALVKEHWTELGYTITERLDEGSVVSMRLMASKPDGQDLTFMAADLGMTLDGVTACVPESSGN